MDESQIFENFLSSLIQKTEKGNLVWRKVNHETFEVINGTFEYVIDVNTDDPTIQVKDMADGDVTKLDRNNHCLIFSLANVVRLQANPIPIPAVPQHEVNLELLTAALDQADDVNQPTEGK